MMRLLPLLLAGCVPANAANPIWTSGGGGASGTLNPAALWSYAKQPTSPNAADLYFDDIGDVADLTDWDAGTQCDALALDASARGAVATVNGAVGDDWCGGFTTTVPSANDWLFTVPLRIDRHAGTVVQQAGIFVGEDLASAPSTGNMWVVSIVSDTGAGGSINWQACADYTNCSAPTEQNTSTRWETAPLLRIHVDTVAETVGAYLSDSGDGRSWVRMGAEISTSGLTIATAGFAGYANGGSIDDQVIYAEFFQFAESADPYEPMGGLVVVE